MLDGLIMLLTLSTLMAIASFLAGSLPLSFSLSQSRLKLISTIGMGVLVGTALIVIIPEGVETLYSAGESHSHPHSRRALSPHSLDVRWQHTRPQHFYIPLLSRRDDSSNDVLKRPPIPSPLTNDPDTPVPKAPEPPPPKDTSTPNIKPPTLPETPSILPDEPPTSSSRTPHAWIGISLVFGFILMYLLDTLPALSPAATSRPQTTNIYSLSDLSSTTGPAISSHQTPQRSLSTTLGLCIHAAADGIALGASSSSSATTSLSLIIFVAIMVHKAPAAFGLTAVLLKQGLGKRGARAHLVVFSLAAPAGAVATWVIVRALGSGGGEEEGMRWWTGVLLLFSGGTFLYVAMHTMQDSDSPEPSYTGLPSEEPLHTNGYLDGTMGNGRGPYRGEKDGKSLKLVLAAVGGMLLPLLTQVGHAH